MHFIARWGFPLSTLIMLLTGVLLSSEAVAQHGVKTFGAGCGPNVGLGCPNKNGFGGPEVFDRNDNQFALEVRDAGAILVQGFELLTKATTASSVNLTTYLYLVDGNTKNAAPVQIPTRTGSMVVKGAFAWYRTVFTQPLQLQRNQTFFLSYKGDNRILLPMLDPESYPTKSVHYWRAPGKTAWQGPFHVGTWAWRVLCSGSAVAPNHYRLGGSATIGQILQLAVSYSNSRLTTNPGLLLIGVSKTQWGSVQLPQRLDHIGAPGCSLLVSPDVVWRVSLTNGRDYWSWQVPNTVSLVGARFYSQCAVDDPSANAAGLAVSNGLEVVIQPR